MIYEVKKDDTILQIDDNVLFHKQPKEFRDLFGEVKNGDTAYFDNCNVLVFETGRVVITPKEEENGTI